MTADPLCPSLVAVIPADPNATPVTTPFWSTVATEVLSDDHVTDLPRRMFPLASLGVADACVVLAIPIVEDANETDTEAIAVEKTVTVANPLRPSLVAVICAAPGLTPVTTPLLLTVAAAVLVDDQVTARSVTMTPVTSLIVAVA
jgi:hypothetical protein